MYITYPLSASRCDYCNRITCRSLDREIWLDKKQTICSRCHSVSYCNQECQKNHWEQHKHNCSEKKTEISDKLITIRNRIVNCDGSLFRTNINKTLTNTDEIYDVIDCHLYLKVIKINKIALKKLSEEESSKKCRLASVVPLTIVTERINEKDIDYLRQYFTNIDKIIFTIIALEHEYIRKYLVIIANKI